MIKISQLSLTYQDADHALLALDRVDLQLSAGRVLALVGESGSGKTSLGNCLLGLQPGNAELSGEIVFKGEALHELSEQQWNSWRWSKLALLFQNGASTLNPVQRVVDQVAEPLIQHRGLKRQVARLQATEALQKLELAAELGERYPHELSGGQIQRVLFAMALILDPAVLVLDEPTAALDSISKNIILETIEQQRQQGKAILLISHDLEVAAKVADQIAVLYLGQIMEVLPAEQFFSNPRHPYTLALGRSFPAIDAVRDLGGIRGDAFYRVVHAHADSDHGHSHTIAPGSVHENGHAPPQGCLFQQRCTQAIDACAKQQVPLSGQGSSQLRCLRNGIAPILQLTGVAKRYAAVTALAEQNLTINSGEVFSLVGETGSGKTTLAMIAAGVMQPDCGSRFFAEQNIDKVLASDRAALARQIGVIYQNPAQAVSHRLRVFDIIAEPIRIQRETVDVVALQQRVREALRDVHLPDQPEFLQRYPHELNLGTLQRICIARALILSPRLLVADEPTSALDPSVQAKVLKLLLKLQTEKGLTLLMVTHDLGLARKVSDRVGIMQQGRLVEIGSPRTLFSRPQHPYSRKLLASAGVHFPTTPEEEK